MKFEIELNDALWTELRKNDKFESDEEALKFHLATMLYHSGLIRISTQLVLLTGKIRAKKLTENKEPREGE